MTFVPWQRDLHELNEEDFPAPQRSVWDVLNLAGVEVPGVADVICRPGSGLDIKKPRGAKRAKIDDDGDPPIRIRIKITMLPSEAKVFRDQVMPIIRTRNKRGGREPLEAAHPQLEFWGVHTILTGDIDAPQPKPGGFMEVEIDALEWTADFEQVTTSGKVRSADRDAERRFPIRVPTAEIALDEALAGRFDAANQFGGG